MGGQIVQCGNYIRVQVEVIIVVPFIKPCNQNIMRGQSQGQICRENRARARVFWKDSVLGQEPRPSSSLMRSSALRPSF
jgi:hypothetical protein